MEDKPRRRRGRGYPYTAYQRTQSAKRREAARKAGKCDSLCGNDVTPGINPRTEKPWISCAACRARQSEAHKRKRDALKAAKDQGSSESSPAPKEHEHAGDHGQWVPGALQSAAAAGA